MATTDSDSNLLELVIYRSTGDWAALYIDGKLEDAGDHPAMQRALESALGVRTVHSDDFLQGGDSREDVAYSLSEIEDYRQLRESGEAEPQLLEAQAEELAERSRILDEQAALLRDAAVQARASGGLSEDALRLVAELRKSLDR